MTVEALRRGSADVLDVLLAQYGRELQRVAYLILHDAVAAEDVVADTLITALERGTTLRDAAALRPWLLRIATNHALTYRRRRIRIVALELMPDVPDERERLGAEIRAALMQGVIALPLRTRAAVVLRYYADLPVEDVAAALGVSTNTVKAQLQSGLQRLRRSLGDEAPLVETPHA
jgi:RNA polymerase sigma-70 factor (ECF subfamily)